MANDTNPKQLMGYCGLYCGGCDIRLLYKEGQSTGTEPRWTDLPVQFQKHLPFKPQPVVCEGCGSDTVFGGCAVCFIRMCAKKKGTVDICTECEKYPCFRFHLLGILSKVFSIQKKLPHQNTRAVNIEKISRIGKDAWLKEQEQLWRCSECHTPFSWYRSTCKNCGRNLDERKEF